MVPLPGIIPQHDDMDNLSEVGQLLADVNNCLPIAFRRRRHGLLRLRRGKKPRDILEALRERG